jgi:hypothetical protein
MYVVLTLPRVFAYLQSELVLSKEQAGEWALKNLDGRHHKIIQEALNCYRTGYEMHIDAEESEDYCDSLLKRIFSEE